MKLIAFGIINTGPSGYTPNDYLPQKDGNFF
jgi:hypothetical protein